MVSDTAINLDLKPSPALLPDGPALLSSREIKPRRVEFLGVARGAAVLYIVCDHVLTTFQQVAPPPSPVWNDVMTVYDAVDLATTGTRLPVLFFMTGIFLDRSVARGTGRFIASRAKTLLWALLLWGLVQAVLFSLVPSLTPWQGLPQRDGLAEVASGFTSLNPLLVIGGWWRLSEQLWFLDMLAVFLGAFLLLRWLPKPVVLAGAALLFVLTLVFERPATGANAALLGVWRLGPYFLYFWLGTMAYDWVVRNDARLTTLQTLLVSGIFLAAAAPLLIQGAEDPARFYPLIFLSGLPAIPLVLNVSKWLLKTPLRVFLVWAGEASLLLLCLHMLTIALVLAAASAMGITSPPLRVLIGAVGGIGLCYVIDMGLRRLGWSAFVGFRSAL